MKPFNIRVYGVLVHDEKLLIVNEPFLGERIFKFPGGGLEFGEGTRDCLKRELKEELNLDIEIGEHIYTQDYFLQSALDPREQIIMIYYKVSAKDIRNLKISDEEVKAFVWKELEELSESDVSLPADKMVVQMLLEGGV